MERLTTKADGKSGVALTFDLDVSLPNMNEVEKLQSIIFRLFDYEDPGLTPAEVAELAQAKRDGRLVALPCKVGDTVYIKGIPFKISFIHIEYEIRFAIQFDCEDCEDCPFYVDEVSWEGEHDCRTQGYIEFTADDIGKTVFLTPSATEKALKESENNERTITD